MKGRVMTGWDKMRPYVLPVLWRTGVGVAGGLAGYGYYDLSRRISEQEHQRILHQQAQTEKLKSQENASWYKYRP